MELDYNNLPETTCPKVDCRKGSKCCKAFSYYSIPASMGDDSEGSEVAPKNGAYCDALVKYENGGAIYLYSKEGIPVMLTNGTETGLFIPHLEIDEATATAILSWTNNVGRENPEPINIMGKKGDQGEKGEKGDPGTAIAIKGEKPTPADLPTDAEEGDAWLVQGDLYVWTGTAWQNVGNIQGPQGEVGPHFTPHLTVDTENDEVILSWTNDGGLDNPDPVNIKGKEGTNANAKVLFSRIPLTTELGQTTTLLISNLDQADRGDISAPETEIYDAYGTLGVVVEFNELTDTMLVKTVTKSPEERQGVRLGTVDTPAQLPINYTQSEALGWQDPVRGDYAYVRSDPDHGDFMAEYLVDNVAGDGTISWVFSHSINAGDYQLKSSLADAGMILTGGNPEGTFGQPIDPGTLQLRNTDAMEGMLLVGGTGNNFGTPIDPEDLRVEEITATEVATLWANRPY